MIYTLRRNLDVTWLPIEKLRQYLKYNGWRVLRTRYDGDRVLMDLAREGQ